MKSVLHNNNWNRGVVQVYVQPPRIALIKSKNYEKLYKDCVKTYLCRNPTSAKSDLYVFKMCLFDNGNPEEFLLFIHNFQMTLGASVALTAGAKIPYLSTLVCGEYLYQIDMFSAQVGSTTSEHLKSIILVLVTYFFLVIVCQNKSARCAA